MLLYELAIVLFLQNLN